MFFVLPFLAVAVTLAGAVVSAVLFAFIPLSSRGANRFGVPSSTTTMVEAVRRSITRMFDFRGRANRKDFWTLAILMAGPGGLVGPGVLIAAIVTANAGVDISVSLAGGIALAALALAAVAALACLSMAVRRLHDVNRSGRWVLLVCVFGYFILLYWFLQPSVRAADEDARIFT